MKEFYNSILKLTTVWFIFFSLSLIGMFFYPDKIDWKFSFASILIYVIFLAFHILTFNIYQKNQKLFVNFFLLLMFFKFLVLAGFYVLLNLLSPSAQKNILALFTIYYLLNFFIFLIYEIKFWLEFIKK